MIYMLIVRLSKEKFIILYLAYLNKTLFFKCFSLQIYFKLTGNIPKYQIIQVKRLCYICL